jgi:PAS domain S-box-containing protein
MNERSLAQNLQSLKERAEKQRSDDSQSFQARMAAANEELKVALEELRWQSRALESAHQDAQAERSRYRDLLQFSPYGCLVTDLDGTVLQVNQTAANMLGASERFLHEKPLAVFVAPEDRRAFRAELMQRLSKSSRVEELKVRLQPREGRAFAAVLTVAVTTDRSGAPLGLRWLVRDAAERQAAPEAESASSEWGRKRPAVVLIVEDNRDGADSLVELIRLWGFHAVAAYDGAAGLAAARRTPRDVALIDVGLPDMDGYEVLRRLRDELGQALVAIAMTGFGGEEENARIQAAGFARRLVKPVDLGELQVLLERPFTDPKRKRGA